MSLRPTFAASLFCISLLFAAGSAVQAVDIGPGDTATDTNDTATDIVVVDLNNPQTLAAGTYIATFFNYQFTNGGGDAIPALEISNSPDVFTTIAVGNDVHHDAATAFVSTPFGGTNTFVVPSGGETVYAAFYSPVPQIPIGFADATGLSFLNYNGANVPVVGQDISGGIPQAFTRTYDFSITVQPVPEPSSLVLAAVAGCLFGIGALRRWRSRAAR